MSAGSQGGGTKVSRDLFLLAPSFRAAVEAAIRECNDAQRSGGPLGAMVYEAYRSPELQAIYYQRGRTVKPPRHTVTNAPTNEYSWHGFGLAVDVVHQTKFWEPEGGERWFRDVAAVFVKHGCKWGGDWTAPDLPHFQWGKCRASPSDRARSLLRSGGVEAVWKEVGALAAHTVGATRSPAAPRVTPPDTEVIAPGDLTALDLDTLVGQSITSLCRNGFHDDKANHCAHFVAHVFGLDFGYTCRSHTGGDAAGANLRVHEVFAECPKVGPWSEADRSRTLLVFVTRADIVSVANKTMGNIPQKHVGIFRDGHVYHYSNGRDQVTKQPVDEFFQAFQQLYAGNQGLFFGEIPYSELQLSVDPGGQAVPAGAIAFQLTRDQGMWMARKVDEPADAQFLTGVEIMQSGPGYFGLYFPIKRYYGPVYDPAAHVGTIDQWAYLLDLTAACESQGRMNLVNSYDRARFTFGFYQLAAHTPDDNLILFFREALQNAEFRRLFPELELRGDRVFRVGTDDVATNLEDKIFDPATGEMQLQRFMAYLNPNRKLIDEQEVLQAARLVWWANQDGECNRLQARIAARILSGKMSRSYHPRYDLDGEPDTNCAIIADIHHQGRAKVATVRTALQRADRKAALLAIGADAYPERIATLTARIAMLEGAGHLGVKRYVAATNEFA